MQIKRRKNIKPQAAEATREANRDKQAARMAKLDAIALLYGFGTWSRYSTAVINGHPLMARAGFVSEEV